MTARRRPGLAVLLVPVVVLCLLVAATDPRDLAARLGAADPGWLALGLALLWGQTALSALRGRVTARALGQYLPAGLAVREYLVAQLVNETARSSRRAIAAIVCRIAASVYSAVVLTAHEPSVK